MCFIQKKKKEKKKKKKEEEEEEEEKEKKEKKEEEEKKTLMPSAEGLYTCVQSVTTSVQDAAFPWRQLATAPHYTKQTRATYLGV